MDQEAEITQEEPETLEQETVEVTPDGETPEGQETPEAQDTLPEERSGWVEDRFQRYSRKLQEVKQKLTQEQEVARQKDEEIKLLRLALEKKDVPKDTGPPNPDEFDGGLYDPEYQKSLLNYNQRFIQSETQRHTAEALKQARAEETQRQKTEEAKSRQIEHWRQAGKLKVKDYEKAEDAAIEILGEDVFAESVRFLDPEDTTLLWYHLGKNPGVAKGLASRIHSNPVSATVEMGRILERVKNTGKTTNPPPPPDEELEGSGVGAKKSRGPKGAKYE